MWKKIAAALSAAAMALTLAACQVGDSNRDAHDGRQGSQGMGTITLGFIPAWTDGLSLAYLMENQLTTMGYDVVIETIGEAALLYQSVSVGVIDVYPSAWPEVTHASYMAKYGDGIEDIGTYFTNARLTWAVPEYLDIDSIDDLLGMAELFHGRIVGIEPGAGLTELSQNRVIPEYGLGDEYELMTSSTTAMLAELKKATVTEQPIVVTLWSPFWANDQFPLKQLEDPKGALGDPKGLHILGAKGFTEKFPEAAEWLGKLELNDNEYRSLEHTITHDFGDGAEAEAVSAWIEKNPDVLPALPTNS